ncbi:dTDP-4-dehydrorhamnose reductase [Sulfurisoma sediminicola]|uniref:dTDP-4-dehydrorhamnose reductase n=1 Tax=Sulfurisoma sediminicola TaxID=1381557 RepID=A0A497XJR6_9PROT|nr:dTDP-4-dehydrorhamnose reductase [Sulfurisoma sediminicola]RLJ67600.1 dTDP-4-dehydrorhamnose reductase [Sulfurisoma sediminicola]
MSDRSILLFGAEGQVGWELKRSLSVLGSVLPLTRRDVDLADSAAVRAAICFARPDAIVNAAAYTAVDRAESERALAQSINAVAPAAMALEAKAAGIPLVLFSSDYCYDGTKEAPYVEGDAPNPQSAYGRSKLAGDKAVAASGAEHLILRTSWVFAARGDNFLKSILRLARERDSLRIVDDQVGAPTSAELLADVTAHALRDLLAGRIASGVYHCTAGGATSWHGYARFIVKQAAQAGLALATTPERVEPIATEDYPLPAVRPKNSRLDCGKLEAALGLSLPPWQWHVRRTLLELTTP